MKRTSTTSIQSQNNKACNGTNESVKIVISLHCVSPFFHVKCKQPTTAKMNKIFIAQKSYCACRVLSLATIRSKYYFNFILNRTRSGGELFDRTSYLQLVSGPDQHRSFAGSQLDTVGGPSSHRRRPLHPYAQILPTPPGWCSTSA